MKQKANSARQTILHFSLAAFASLLLFQGAAQEQFKKEETIQIHYLGNRENKPLFQVDVNNSQNKNFKLTIHDPAGYQLYSVRIHDKFFTKKFQWDNPESSDKLIISLKSDGNKESRTFQINTTTRLVQDVAISRF